MKQTDYIKMVEMLSIATVTQKICWDEKNSSFSTKIGGCLIELTYSYDFNVNTYTYYLKLYNNEGRLFETMSFSDDENTEEYNRLNELYANIRDIKYRITESEKIILDNLKDLINKSGE